MTDLNPTTLAWIAMRSSDLDVAPVRVSTLPPAGWEPGKLLVERVAALAALPRISLIYWAKTRPSEWSLDVDGPWPGVSWEMWKASLKDDRPREPSTEDRAAASMEAAVARREAARA